MGYMKGQGATEYLVLLAVVLIIALVSIALLGFFPGLASDARITQSNSYWRGEARPFAILEHSVTSGGVMTLIMQNNDATGSIGMTNISIGAGSNGTSTITFAPGESRTVTVSGVASSPASGSVYDLQVNITYTTPNGIAGKQYGAKNVVGKVI
ncbi:TPA: hypothetical protein HA225_03310 [Candidatus Micrarchaeota archaeon]|nr:hypothetical protein [Candidatus Micrarchaeota archaeon]HIH30257.1 hypothetical protein [Candidatus Micrarchaeota archaeon]